MPTPTNKAELKIAIQENYAKLNLELLDISEEMAARKEMPGHAKDTQMSVHDLLAYLLGWGTMVINWHAKKTKYEKVDFPETGFKWNQLGLLAQKFYADYENDSFENLKIKLEKTTQQILEIIDETSDYELYGMPWYEKYPFGKMIQLNTASPFKNAKDRIKKWRKGKC
jgi:hypothetical protein